MGSLKGILLGMILFSFMMTGAAFLFKGAIDEYDINASLSDRDANFTTTYNIINGTFNYTKESQLDVFASEIDEGGEETYASMIKGAYSAVKKFFSLIFSPFKIAGGLIREIGLKVGIPGWVVNFGIVALTAILIFAVIALLFKFKE